MITDVLEKLIDVDKAILTNKGLLVLTKERLSKLKEEKRKLLEASMFALKTELNKEDL